MAEVEIVKTSDFGVNDTTYRVMTHLGHLLSPGDSVMGYDIVNSNIGHSGMKLWGGGEGDVITRGKVRIYIYILL